MAWIFLFIFICFRSFYRAVYKKGFQDGEKYNHYLLEEEQFYKDYFDSEK
jgi:hypothetical protein